MGQSGRGKTTSLRNLDPERVALFNTEMKPLPFPNNQKKWEARNTYLGKWDKNMKPLSPYILFDYLIQLREREDIEVVVIDSFTSWTDHVAEECVKKFGKSFEVWSEYARQITMLFDLLKSSGKYCFLIGHDEVVQIEDQATKRLKVGGKKWEGMCEKEALVVLYSTVSRDEEGKLRYVFQTQTDGVTSAKSPMGMFEEFEIDNDLQMIVERMKAFYSDRSEEVTAKEEEVKPALKKALNKK